MPIESISAIIGASLALIGLVTLILALTIDRSRNRRRCPRCWYDLRGTPTSLTCSECGHTAKNERKLHRTRRHWRWVILSAILFLTGWTTSSAPRISDEGGYAFAPTTGLIIAIPWINNQKVFDTLNQRFYEYWEYWGSMSVIEKPAWHWQQRLYLNRCTLAARSPRLNSDIRFKAFSAIVNDGDTDRIARLLGGMVADPRFELRDQAYIWMLSFPYWIELPQLNLHMLLLEAINRETIADQIGAAAVFAHLPERAFVAVPRLIELLDSPSNPVRKESAKTLGAIGPEAVRKAWDKLMWLVTNDDVADVRAAAFKATAVIHQLDQPDDR